MNIIAKPPLSPTLADLRRHFAQAAAMSGPALAGRIGFGAADLDSALGGGLVRSALHEIYASGTASLPAATVVALGLAWRAAGERPILWARQDVLDAEAGRPYPPGLMELGFDPARVLLVRGRDAAAVLRAGAEAARCPALGAVLIEPWGEPRALDLTASRRLTLIAEASGVFTLLLRAARPQASAAQSRWLVEEQASLAREAHAPGDPVVRLTLLRQRGGLDQGEWRVEWNRDRQCFEQETGPPAFAHPEKSLQRSPDATSLSRSVVAFPAYGPALAERPDADRRRVG